jgi:hypothetical protein
MILSCEYPGPGNAHWHYLMQRMVRAERAQADFAKTLAASVASARAEECALATTTAAYATRTAAAATYSAAALPAVAPAAAALAAALPRADAAAQVKPEVANVSCSIDTLSAVLAEAVEELGQARASVRELQNALDAHEVVGESLRTQLDERDGRVRCLVLF